MGALVGVLLLVAHAAPAPAQSGLAIIPSTAAKARARLTADTLWLTPLDTATYALTRRADERAGARARHRKVANYEAWAFGAGGVRLVCFTGPGGRTCATLVKYAAPDSNGVVLDAVDLGKWVYIEASLPAYAARLTPELTHWFRVRSDTIEEAPVALRRPAEESAIWALHAVGLTTPVGALTFQSDSSLFVCFGPASLAVGRCDFLAQIRAGNMALLKWRRDATLAAVWTK
jgi:hypothetical protein